MRIAVFTLVLVLNILPMLSVPLNEAPGKDKHMWLHSTSTPLRSHHRLNKSIPENFYSSKPKGDAPFNFSRHSNVIWAIGGVFFLAGLFLAGICGVVILKISRGNLVIWLGGFLIGLALIVLSLPFMLVGAIID